MSGQKGARILVVDDHEEMSRLLADRLEDAGFVVECAGGGKDALARVRAEVPDLVITDLRMEEVDGFDVLAGVHEVDPELPVIVMTAFGAIETAIEAIKRGAYHYLTKPFQLGEVIVFVQRALEDRRVRSANEVLRRAVELARAGEMIGASAPMRALGEMVARVAPSAAPVLITGESGTGKELVARALHAGSARREQPFVAVNCTAIPESLLESELFGHTRGAFSGATAARRGLFAESDGGTLFLDEIGDMSPALQAKMLRVLQDGQVRAVGSDAVRRVDVRVVAATNQDLERRVAAGQFRSDLFFRLNVVSIAVPPLRERRDDVPALVETFVAQARRRNPASRARRISAEVLERLQAYHWPGNVRELENLIERLVILCEVEEVGLDALERYAAHLASGPFPLEVAMERVVKLRELEDLYIAWVVQRCGGNKTRAAEILGIDVSTIHRRERDRAAS
ncbi:MAG TPA: sigma-54 dependent transcriptional regulator [Anaeromyxobacter sp.]|nr:sigma-54 dependent transcriptional regulator [Anaeromyxobacter sp.]